MPPRKSKSGAASLKAPAAPAAAAPAAAAPAAAVPAAAPAAPAIQNGRFINKKRAIETGNLGLSLEIGKGTNVPSAFNSNNENSVRVLSGYREPKAPRERNMYRVIGPHVVGPHGVDPHVEENINVLYASTPPRVLGAAAGAGGAAAGGAAAAGAGFPSARGPVGLGPHGALSPNLLFPEGAASAALSLNRLMNLGQGNSPEGSTGGKRRRTRRHKRRSIKKRRN